MQLFTFSGTTVLLGLAGAVLFTAIGVALLRRHLRTASTVSSGTKSRTGDVFSLSPVVHRYALSAAIFTAFLTLNWTEYGPETVYSPQVMEESVIEVDVPITYRKPQPPPPPPPPPVIEPVPDSEAPTVEQIDQSITEADEVFPEEPVLVKPKRVPPPPPMPQPRVEDDKTILIYADHMPVFGKTCLEFSGEERKACSDRELMQFIAGQIKYPAMARGNDIEGTVFVRFVVEKDGSVSSVEALREVPGGCTEEALRAVRQINDKTDGFRPGLQGGRPVRVMFNMPVKFQLDR